MYSFLPKFTSEISIYHSIALQKNHVASSRTLITNTIFKSWNGIALRYIHDMFKSSSLLRYSILKASCITDGIILTSAENNYMSKKAIFLRDKNMVRNKQQKKKS